MSWGDPLVVTLVALAGFASVTVAARRGRRQLIATATASLALAVLAAAPAPPRRDETTILLTEGATPSDFTNEGLELDPSTGTYAIGDDPSWPRWVERISDSGAVTRQTGTPRSLTVTGHGLDTWDAERLISEGFRVGRAAVPPKPSGITRVAWRRDLTTGRRLIVTGAVTGSGEVTVRLEGPGRSAEQALSLDSTETPFTLEVVPPGPGQFLFSLSIEHLTVTEPAGTIDVHVRPAAPPSLLWLERSPSFETRHVKQWLAEAGGSLAVRSAVSRDRSLYEYHNLDRMDLSRLTPDRLDSFDIVVVDSGTWAGLAGSERQAIEQAVGAGKMGLVLRLDLRDGALREAPFGVAIRQVDGLDQLMVRPAALDDPPGPIAVPPFELDAPGVPLFQDRAGRVLAVRRPVGRGAAAVTTLTGSYRWVLEGRPDAHRAYWLALLEAVAPPDEEPRWLIPGGPILVHEPLIMTMTGDEPPAVRLVEPDGLTATVPMRQHPTRPDRFSAILWPRLRGWHRLEAGDTVALFHPATSPGWATWKMVRRRDATALAVARSPSSATPSQATIPWTRLLALALLVAALAWAWIDERRSAA